MTIRARQRLQWIARIRPRLGRLATASATLAILAVATGCGPTEPTPPPSTQSPSPSPSPSPSVSAPPATPSTAADSPSGPPLPAGVTVDPGLLEVLPAEIDGVPLEPDPTTADEVSRDPLLAESALSIAVALAVAAGASGTEDLGVANVIRLRPDVFDEAFYQEWRDTYNEAACEVADGVESEQQTEIGGHQTYVGTCVGGAETFHTYLVDQGFLVSVTATGKRRFGELIIAALAG